MSTQLVLDEETKLTIFRAIRAYERQLAQTYSVAPADKVKDLEDLWKAARKAETAFIDAIVNGVDIMERDQNAAQQPKSDSQEF